jgi:hypothetical protein
MAAEFGPLADDGGFFRRAFFLGGSLGVFPPGGALPFDAAATTGEGAGMLVGPLGCAGAPGVARADIVDIVLKCFVAPLLIQSELIGFAQDRALAIRL